MISKLSGNSKQKTYPIDDTNRFIIEYIGDNRYNIAIKDIHETMITYDANGPDASDLYVEAFKYLDTIGYL